jgi:sugar phosphate isomerase/epimerase
MSDKRPTREGDSRRIAFSTLGCPDMDLDEVLGLAAFHGFTGLELRAAPGQQVHVELGAAQRAQITDRLRSAAITALSVASYVKVADPTVDDAGVIGNGIAHLQLASDLEAGFLRVFPGGASDSDDRAGQDRRAARRLAALAEVAADLGVVLALETHDSHRRAADIRRILDQPGCRDVRVVWDPLHTWLGGEPTSRSWELLADRLGYVQVKDVPSHVDLTPVLMGTGVLPLTEVASQLRAVAYTGWVSWEYERAWHPDRPALAELAAPAADWMRQTFFGCGVDHQSRRRREGPR